MTRARDLAAFVSNADGDIKFDTDTLFIDSSTNRVGLGTNAPSVQLDIESTAPTIRLTDSDASGTPESEVSGAGGDITIKADRDNEKASSLIGFEVDGTERMRINSSGEVNIGTTSTLLSAANRANITLNGTSEGIINLGINGSQGGYLYQTATDLAVWNTKNGPLRFAANNAEVARFLSGGGLTFNGDTAAANALDDYEEGTWTPVLRGTGSVSGQSYGSAVGTYTKVGRTLVASFTVTLSAKGTMSGDCIVAGLPFTSISASTGGGSVGFITNTGVTITDVTMNGATGHAFVYLQYINQGTTYVNNLNLLTNTTRVDGVITVQVA